jgi:two-component system chemotaxis sensor kinase CheA
LAGVQVTPAAELGSASRSPSGHRSARIPEAARHAARHLLEAGDCPQWIVYRPAPGCFFNGEDPLLQARRTPGVVWQSVVAPAPWPPLAELDAYRSVLEFQLLSSAPPADLLEHYRYMPDCVEIQPVLSGQLAVLEAPPADTGAAAIQAVGGAGSLRPAHPAAETAAAADDAADLATLLATQREILTLPVEAPWHLGRLQAAGRALAGCLHASGRSDSVPALEVAVASAAAEASSAPLLEWFDGQFPAGAEGAVRSRVLPADAGPSLDTAVQPTPGPTSRDGAAAPQDADAELKFGRRADDGPTATKSLKVDAVKIDRLMDLIGEIVVAKNALPYLADRAESVFGVRELSREIKAQFAVINRISEEMQDAIMQVRMMPVSFVFQRFPRLVRDISRKLGKDVRLVLEGEDTEADKNIIESLGDPLVHIVRNSLDHGFEVPDARRAAGKAPTGTLTIRARQESDRVVIEIEDDGRGIDPQAIRQKAYEKGLIDEAALERISDQDAINLVFAPGFSTVEVISDLSGRGVGMDVVRSAIERVNGSIALESRTGLGTRIRLSLPLSMAVTNVMIVESAGQLFGVPMDSVVETVRVPRTEIRAIKQAHATVLRGRVVPLKSINRLLGLAAPPLSNADDELAVLVVRIGDESVGLLVDEFRATVDIILKPLTGVLAGLLAYSGSALMGDGSVLMVLNIKELV